MAKLPEQRKILPEDFPEQKWIDQLLAPINRFFEDTVRILNKRLTVTENMDGELLQFTVDGTYPLDVRWTRPTAPKAAWIGYCRETSGSHTNFTDPLFLDWEFSSKGAFRINNITGLTPTPSAKYHVTVVAIVG